MKCSKRFIAPFAAAFALVLAVPVASHAQTFPSKPVRLVVPYGPAGLPDALARLTGQKLSEGLGQQVIIDNKAGASGMIGAQFAAKAEPDGHTIFLYDNNIYAINPVVYPKLPYESRDFIPVTQAVRGHMYLVSNPSLPVNSVQELVAHAKANPGMPYGSPGNATIHHLAMEQFKNMAGINLTHVPYKGTAQSIPGLLSGDVSVMFVALTAVAPLAKSGKVKILAAGSPDRPSSMPTVATVAEAGFPGFLVESNMGYAVPAGTPRAIVARLHAEIVKAVRSPDVEAKMPALGVDVVANSPEQFAEQVKKDQEYYIKLVRQTNFKIE
jgi:tripartite-type tricarboxylate transporter receptor subunit TctC